MKTNLKLGIIIGIVVLAAAACGGSSTSSATISAIAISPSPCALGRTDSLQMSALATLPDGTKMDITSRQGVAWMTGNSNTATANPTGVVVGVNAGITAITAEYQGPPAA
jgi:hypothetical protein